ncbi:NADPH:quinone reductase and related Zn-dependent oxidoreductase [Amycolatopsis mediterranei S699]|uniref:NADPH:quinone reductase and related Zn-dependent oxidoreductase n=2 Tax=Amycolatopsis mediterranei TaxID=33910 RepID=A0A0H3D9G7_AMYMU|nr:medium chain dehydrogenase/reductase family protein [Amycolatopsis mediterranei]ADJ46189.1 NADPH:quinone reductase and related Zn-dependent oxidoreductase [Amycolatopsis mediterranei U32]AEK42980.1 NADPH:quinone reductase and related Zn-dependent oxidoreductase [Amycolatopsis mediterranei S699]AFO77900.1 NADPH:quinone reductase and related Zn-dependent oxidoreductase [Amycolatopsis mediterranei S699]AGT85028.1 NADPH:quinone reductase-related Zn-dependent oxidoreductase [Amycolatopsis mediter
MNVTEIVLPGLVEPDGLRVEHRELPPLGAGEALIRVEASGISFAEQQMRRGKYYDQPPFPFAPGYDVVGTVLEAEDPALIGRRVAALTKIGGWSSHLVLSAADLVPVPDALDAAEAETFVVNGITAYQMLHRWAKVKAGGTILVHGASGGVGTTLVQLARAAGIKVIGTASARNLDVVTALGATAVDYRGDVPARVRALAPGGVDAVFDHVGGPGIVDSFRLLAPGGALIAYGSASTVNTGGNPKRAVLKLVARLLWWNTVPNRRRAHFYNVWGGKRNLTRFRLRLAEDLTAVFELAAKGQLKAQVAARIPLTEAGKALALAESGTVTGKVVLVP